MWNSGDKSGVSLVSAGEAIQADTDGVVGGARSLTSHTTGKWCARALIVNGGGQYEFGLASAGSSLTTQRAAGHIIAQQNGDVYVNGGNTDFMGSITGQEVDIAYDGDNDKAWFRKQFTGDPPGSWSGGFPGNPVTNSGGYSTTFLGGTVFLFGLTNIGTDPNITLQEIPTSDLPAGFANWLDGEPASSEIPSSAPSSEPPSSEPPSSAPSSEPPSSFASSEIPSSAPSSEPPSSMVSSEDSPVAPPVQVVIIC